MITWYNQTRLPKARKHQNCYQVTFLKFRSMSGIRSISTRFSNTEVERWHGVGIGSSNISFELMGINKMNGFLGTLPRATLLFRSDRTKWEKCIIYLARGACIAFVLANKVQERAAMDRWAESKTLTGRAAFPRCFTRSKAAGMSISPRSVGQSKRFLAVLTRNHHFGTTFLEEFTNCP